MRMYKAVIFDFFGVIYSDPANRWFKKHDIERSGEYADVFKQVDHGFITIEEAFKHLSDLSGHPESEIKEVFGQTDMIDHEVVSIIQKLNQTYDLCLLSNASSGYLRRILAENALDGLFDELIISSEVNMIKPDPRVFELTLDRLGLEASEAIFVDDWKENINSAERLGIKGIVFDNSSQLIRDLQSSGINL